MDIDVDDGEDELDDDDDTQASASPKRSATKARRGTARGKGKQRADRIATPPPTTPSDGRSPVASPTPSARTARASTKSQRTSTSTKAQTQRTSQAATQLSSKAIAPRRTVRTGGAKSATASASSTIAQSAATVPIAWTLREQDRFKKFSNLSRSSEGVLVDTLERMEFLRTAIVDGAPKAEQLERLDRITNRLDNLREEWAIARKALDLGTDAVESRDRQAMSE